MNCNKCEFFCIMEDKNYACYLSYSCLVTTEIKIDMEIEHNFNYVL